jgi:hypothetical protein
MIFTMKVEKILVHTNKLAASELIFANNEIDFPFRVVNHFIPLPPKGGIEKK